MTVPRPSIVKFEDIDAAFTFERRVASTSVSNIWLCRPTRSCDQYVVIKELEVKKISNPQHVLNEKNIMELLTESMFPCAPKLIGTAKTKDSLFVVMELIEGAPLHMHVCGNGFPLETAKRYFGELLSIIEYMHDHNILYRDLKLSNILLRRSNGRLCLCDFGLSKIVKNRTNSVCGTLHAMAPEIKSGSDYGFEADFWSLGILLFELIEGKAPFGYTDVDADRIRSSPSSIKFERTRHTPESIDLISQLLTVDPGRRLSSFTRVRKHAFFSGCTQEWWDWCRYDPSSTDDPYLPVFNDQIGRDFIFGPQTLRVEDEGDIWANF